jgi:rare lipoprotein A
MAFNISWLFFEKKILSLTLVSTNLNNFILKIAFILCFLWHNSKAQQLGKVQVGWASYYGKQFHGRKTSNHEKYDMNKLTAAHRTFKFNTMVKVTNLSNNKSVIVRINDRGPYAKKRIIDISKAASDKIDMTKKGTVKVKVEIVGFNGNVEIETEDAPVIDFKNENFTIGKHYDLDGNEMEVKGFGIQIISGKDFMLVRDKALQLKNKNIDNIIIEVGEVNNSKFFRLMSGECQSKAIANKYLNEILKPKGYTGFIKQYL